jgi:hypothetical protein
LLTKRNFVAFPETVPLSVRKRAGRFGRHFYLLPILKPHGFCIHRAYSHGARPLAFVPLRVSHDRIGVIVHVSAGIENQGILGRRYQAFGLDRGVQARGFDFQLRDEKFYSAGRRVNMREVVVLVRPADPESLGMVQKGLKNAIALIGARFFSSIC